jgi:hypothetical protein
LIHDNRSLARASNNHQTPFTTRGKMNRFFKIFFGAAIPFAVVIFAISISNNSWQRALGLAVILAFLFGSGVTQIITIIEERRKAKKK